MATMYKTKTGLNYPDPKRPGKEKRAEAGVVVNDLPASSVKWLLEQGYIEPAVVAAVEVAVEE